MNRDIESLFEHNNEIGKDAAFEALVMSRLRQDIRARRGGQFIAGGSIGLLALSQIIRIPMTVRGVIPSHAVSVSSHDDILSTTQGWLFEVLEYVIVNLINNINVLFKLLNQPTVLWLGLALSFGLMIQYLVTSQEDTL